MPIIRGDQGNQARTTFKPPWVRDGPTPLPMPAAPWTARARENAASSGSTEEAPKFERPTLRKQSKISIVPSQAAENGQVINATNQKPPTPSNRKISTDKIVPIFRDSNSNQKKVAEIPVQKPSPAKDNQPKETSKPSTQSSLPPMPPPPPPTSGLPPPPPMPGGLPPIERKPVTPEKLARLEALRSRPRRRPDWTDMMKEVESGKKLKHVECNDRSAPVLPSTKAKGQFLYDSETKSKDDSHNALLKEIQFGVKLKRVKCNDRSKPNIDGLRKFRRQMTVEEQIQKSMSMADVVAAAAEPDELDDIDKVRDDLQSSKQMLAQELRNKEALERENKRLMARLLNLEAELEKEKGMRLIEAEKGATIVKSRTEEDEKLIVKLKEDAQEADKIAKEMEEKYHATAEELDNTRRKLESAWLRNQELEIQLKAAEAQGVKLPPSLIKAPSSKKLAQSIANMANGKSLDLSDDDSEEYEEETETESEDSENETNAAEKEERRTARELKLLETKVRSYKEKQQAAQKERKVLREQMKKQQKTLREEKKKFKVLQKEVDKMAKLMRDAEEEEEEEEEEEVEEEAEEEEETETESESEESSSEDESDDEIPEDADTETKKKLLTEKTKRYDTRLTTLKKGNYLLKANIDRLQDDISRQKEMQVELQEDLNSILTDLG